MEVDFDDDVVRLNNIHRGLLAIANDCDLPDHLKPRQARDFSEWDRHQKIGSYQRPQYLLQNHIELVVAHIKETIRRKKISKRFLAEHLKTSDNQVQRLLNPAILNKNLAQLYKIATLLGLEFDWHIKEAI